jgi:ammonium transporter, Amt family
MTSLFIAISFAFGALATLAIFQLVRPVIGGRMVWPAIVAAALCTIVTSAVGVLTGAARLDYLLGICAFVLPVLVLLEAAAIGSGSDRLARWVLMLTWGLIVFPGAALIPLVLTEPCRFSGCGFEDFGGALPLFVSAAAYVLLAWSPPDAVPAPQVRGSEAIAGVLGFWVAFALWLTSLEADLDAYIPRILLAGVVGPAAGALGWLLVDVLKATGRAPTRSLGFGFLAGIAATASGAVIVSFPWSAVVGVLAGIVGALIHSARPLATGALAPRWGLTLLGATAVGFLAPPVSGDTVGILFSAQVGVLATPLLAFIGVALGAALVSAPVWVLLRRRQPRRTPPVAESTG